MLYACKRLGQAQSVGQQNYGPGENSWVCGFDALGNLFSFTSNAGKSRDCGAEFDIRDLGGVDTLPAVTELEESPAVAGIAISSSSPDESPVRVPA